MTGGQKLLIQFSSLLVAYTLALLILKAKTYFVGLMLTIIFKFNKNLFFTKKTKSPSNPFIKRYR
jgi:hypothetical protein